MGWASFKNSDYLFQFPNLIKRVSYAICCDEMTFESQTACLISELKHLVSHNALLTAVSPSKVNHQCMAVNLDTGLRAQI